MIFNKEDLASYLMGKFTAFSPCKMRIRWKRGHWKDEISFLDFNFHIPEKKDAIACWLTFFSYDDQVHAMFPKKEALEGMEFRLWLKNDFKTYDLHAKRFYKELQKNADEI